MGEKGHLTCAEFSHYIEGVVKMQQRSKGVVTPGLVDRIAKLKMVKALEEADTDKNGMVSFEEFKNWAAD